MEILTWYYGWVGLAMIDPVDTEASMLGLNTINDKCKLSRMYIRS